MQMQKRVEPGSRARNLMFGALMSAGLLCFSAGAQAQTATISGSLGNFDVVNNTGENACGFEMDLEGVTAPIDSIYSFSMQRYGASTIAPYTNGAVSGMRVTWKSADCSANHTVPHAPGTAFGGTCYQWYASTYDTVGCEHFGLSFPATSATKVTSRWLVNDPANPGTYVPHDPPIVIAVPSYLIAPPPVANGGGGAVAAAPPVVVAVVEAPEPAESPELYGNAQWIKVFVRQLAHVVTLEELVTDNPVIVPMDPAQVEVNWGVIQAEPASNSKSNRSQKQGSSTLDPTTRTVVRRYELYDFTGAYDPVTHEALCADLTCSAPAATELGDFISAQMAAVAVQGDFLTVTKSGSGSGNVDSADKRIACGSKCVSPYTAGTLVTLTAKASSGSAFTGWTGACSGTPQTCTVTVNGAQAVGAIFDTQVAAAGGGGGGGGGATASNFTVKVSASNSGTITSDVGGINCGLACSATVAAGTVVTLTATPPTGKTFAGWSGACIGTANTCTLTVNANLSAKANFSK